MTSRRPRDWSPEEKLNAVIEAQPLSEEELGAFLRRKGLHEAQLQEWRTIILAGIQGHPQRAGAKPSAGDARRIRELEKELDRKDKPLAETDCRHFLTGKYKRFAVVGPLDLLIVIERGNSPNAQTSGVFLKRDQDLTKMAQPITS